MTNGCPIATWSFSATMRATRSTPPPGAWGAITLIARDGYVSCEKALDARKPESSSAAATMARRRASPAASKQSIVFRDPQKCDHPTRRPQLVAATSAQGSAHESDDGTRYQPRHHARQAGRHARDRP